MAKTIIADTQKGMDLAYIELCKMSGGDEFYLLDLGHRDFDKEQMRTLIRGLQFAIGDKVTEAENA